ncbi:MAG: sensor histidine kinase, partial [Gammaproteobacteria bacterium]
QGTVIFSTRPNQLEREQAENPGFVSAMRGDVASKLVYRDSLNAFDDETEDDNLIQTYMPVRLGPTSPIVGVFEIYTDVNHLVGRVERAQFLVIAGVSVVLSLSFAFLLYIALRAERIINAQEAVIRDRSRSLELLSAELMRAQEAERKRIAEELHEGIAQTLSAIKIGVEDLSCAPSTSKPSEMAARAKRMMPAIQSAIGEVRKVAMDLRPSSLDDFGVVATIEWFCSQFKSIYTGVRIRTELGIQEDDVSRPLKVIIFRVLQESLHYLVVDAKRDDIRIGLESAGDSTALTLEGESVSMSTSIGAQTSDETLLRSRLSALSERIAVSGGTLLEDRKSPDRVTLRAVWPA